MIINGEQYITIEGIASIIFGVFDLISYGIGILFYSFVDNRLYGMALGIIFGVIAIILGHIAKKHGDYYGKYGMILGGFVIIITTIIALLTTPTSVEIRNYS